MMMVGLAYQKKKKMMFGIELRDVDSRLGLGVDLLSVQFQAFEFSSTMVFYSITDFSTHLLFGCTLD